MSELSAKAPVVININDWAAVNAAKDADTYVYIGRNSKLGTTRWGNPYRVGRDGDVYEVIRRYETYQRIRLEKEPVFRGEIYALTSKVLVCHCAPAACHGAVLVKLWKELCGDKS